jgi:hypothetical protein
MSVNGAQIRLVYEYIHANNGQWVTSTSSWVDASAGQLASIQETIAKGVHRADRRNWRIEYRRFSIQVHAISTGTSWPTLNEIIEENDDTPIQWVCVDGNPDDGFAIIGPFDDQGTASQYGRANGSGDFWSMKLERPL